MATVNLSSIITPANVLTASGTATLTNKTIAFGSNTLTDVASLATSQTLTNKTINIASNTLTGVQSTLVSGTSIKTINSTSLLGSGDIALSSGLTLVQTVTASGSTAVINGFSSTYDNYKLLIRDVFPSADGRNFELKFFIDGTLITGSYQYAFVNVSSSGFGVSTDAGVSSNDTIRLANSMDQSTFNRSNQYEIDIFGVNGASTFKSIIYNGIYHFGDNALRIMGAGTQKVTYGILTGLQFSFPGSSFGGGTLQLYGFAKA